MDLSRDLKEFETPYGTFTLRRATVADDFRILKRRQALLQRYGLDGSLPEAAALAQAVATLEVLAVNAPDGLRQPDGTFDWDRFPQDWTLLNDLLQRYGEWQASFRGAATPPGVGAGAGGDV